jgi:outer membrane immunogenic protein
VQGGIMKEILPTISAVVALAAIGSARAADLPVKAPVTPSFNWTSCYIGAEGGAAWGQSKHVNVAGSTDTDITPTFDMRGALFGGTLGCNWQVSPFLVVGTEADLSWTNKKGSANDVNGFNPNFTSQTQERWLALERARIGITPGDPHWLWFLASGVAAADIQIDVTGPAFPTQSEDHVRLGWTVGGGVEWAFAPNWSAKLEYLYVQFEDKQYFTPPPAGFSNRAGGVPVTDSIVRAGINYHFDWGPVVAKY